MPFAAHNNCANLSCRHRSHRREACHDGRQAPASRAGGLCVAYLTAPRRPSTRRRRTLQPGGYGPPRRAAPAGPGEPGLPGHEGWPMLPRACVPRPGTGARLTCPRRPTPRNASYAGGRGVRVPGTSYAEPLRGALHSATLGSAGPTREAGWQLDNAIGGWTSAAAPTGSRDSVAQNMATVSGPGPASGGRAVATSRSIVALSLRFSSTLFAARHHESLRSLLCNE